MVQRGGHKPDKKQLRELRKDAKMVLLPNTFSKTEQIGAWIDPRPMTLVMAATSQTKTDEVVTALIHCVEGMKIKAFGEKNRTARARRDWLTCDEGVDISAEILLGGIYSALPPRNWLGKADLIFV
ncbi:recombination-associated protein RdgC [Polaromonas sp. UBA4122]|uniref:recombination-associated protein RdgC n=1 Tax=Polaromonas sp. UBA4122 TaxID=1947074 RepID=UPI0025DEB87F|nr:recombination-associated protein RdgC [Polaromonas sp. UBA4122]